MKHNKQQGGEMPVDADQQAAEAVQPQQPESNEETSMDYQAELAKQKDAYLRLYAEFDNFKKRSAREKTEWIKFASSDVLTALLPVIDDFERGLAVAAKEGCSSAETEGFSLIHHKLMEILRQKGLLQIEVKKGDELNVDVHDAVARIPAPEEALRGRIVDVIQKGYKIGDHVIRYAKVVVGE